ncbi:MAG TPA: DinB family protein [Gemmatimonadales bacterium]|nr:DinB family protein [Gemmatimonadales bacterium]
MTTATIPRPASSEYAPHFETYIAKVPKGDLLRVLEEQVRETQRLLSGLPEAKALHRYAPGKWSVKEVVGHVTDSERVFCYRALRFARADEKPLQGYDENAWVPAGRFDARPLEDLAAELDAVRRATIALFRGLDGESLGRRGTANNTIVSVRALAWIIAGHERHHVGILHERYGV